MSKNYAQIIDEFDLAAMLWRLNDACGTGRSLALADLQEIRRFVERISVEEHKPVKQANIHTVTLYHDGHTVEILRRGSGQYGPSAQRRYRTSQRLHSLLSDLCHAQGEIYSYHANFTTYRICEYVPQV